MIIESLALVHIVPSPSIKLPNCKFVMLLTIPVVDLKIKYYHISFCLVIWNTLFNQTSSLHILYGYSVTVSPHGMSRFLVKLRR